jgi:tRNA A-37 threonylcarbamoyl transferase component Bud32
MAFSLNDYTITGTIGQGGFASVFRARQKSLSREVAIKRLSPERTQNADEILRFRREAEAMASLTHDNIIAVFDYAFHNGSYYIIMEYVEGMAFDAALGHGLPQECGLFVLEKTAGALTIAHSQNIIHRDVKPANILLGRNGQVKLADFGLALFQTGMESLSVSGSILGTISYMAPEALVSPKEVDSRVDVFSIGCIVYEALAGKHPFGGTSFGEIADRILNEEPCKPPAAGFPRLADAVMQCLHKDREKRPGMQELYDELKAAVHAGYHTAQEKLIAFVRQGCKKEASPDAAAVPADTAVTAHGKNLRQRIPYVPVLIAAAVIAAAAMLIALFHPTATVHKSPASSLPMLPALDVADVREASPGAQPGAQPRHAEKAVVKDGPAPVTGAAVDMNAGILVFRGLAAQDTVLLNSKAVTVVPGQNGEMLLELLPGYYRLDIRRNSGRPLLRELELVPFERQIIDLRKEKR